MEAEVFWQTFAETGDPVCYMLYQAAQNQRPEKKSDPGEASRVPS